MLPLHHIIKRSAVVTLILFLSLGSFSCRNKNYPCPGLGQSDPADLSMFDDSGQLKGKHKKKGRIDKTTGKVNKKTPKKIRKPRRTKI